MEKSLRKDFEVDRNRGERGLYVRGQTFDVSQPLGNFAPVRFYSGRRVHSMCVLKFLKYVFVTFL